MDRFCSNKGKKSQTSKTEALIGKCYRSLHSRPKITMVVGYWIGIKNVLVRPLLYYRISQRHCNNKSAEQLKAYRCHGTEEIIWFFSRFQGGGGRLLTSRGSSVKWCVFPELLVRITRRWGANVLWYWRTCMDNACEVHFDKKISLIIKYVVRILRRCY